MSEQKIQSQDISIGDVFKSFYVVPDYQREYVWEDEQVEQLLTDIREEWNGVTVHHIPEYFIGSIVVCPGKGGLLDLIDGQQRMTTLFVTLCAIRDYIKSLGKEPPKAIDQQIASPDTNANGEDVFRYRLELQYEDSGGALERIASGTASAEGSAATLSMRNIAGAYACVQSFLKREFDADDAALRRFYAYLITHVKLIRIQASDVAKALKIFETINDRGVGLNAMDLLKNLLFMKAGQAEFEALKTTWKQLQDTLYEIPEKPLRFLRYYIVSQFDVTVLREDEIYEWFADNAVKCGYDKKPLAFAKELLDAARAYGHFVAGKDPQGKVSWPLENLQLLGGKAARQHLILLLSGRSLPPPMFDALCREVENLFFCYVLVRKPTRDFEKAFATWASRVRKATTMEELEAVFGDTFAKDKEGLAERFAESIDRLTSETLQAYRLKYVLAKLNQHIELAAYGAIDKYRWLKNYLGYEIEHVYPQNPSPQAAAEFGAPTVPNVAQRLGNLVLVEKSINASLGNRAYSEKRQTYPKSTVLLTHALAAKPQIGSRTKIDAAVADFVPYAEWNEAAIARRQRQLVQLACRVWNVPVFPLAPLAG